MPPQDPPTDPPAGGGAVAPDATAAVTPRSPGAHLRAAREAAGISIGDIAQQLKLLPRQVDAIERDDYQALPGPVFARGFVRNYARALHVDPATFAAELDAALPGDSTPRALVTSSAPDGPRDKPVFEPFPRRHKPASKGLVATAIAVVAIVLVALYLQQAEPDDAPVAASAPAVTAPPPTPEPAVAAPAAGNAATQAVVLDPQVASDGAPTSAAVAAPGSISVAGATSAPAAPVAVPAAPVAASDARAIGPDGGTVTPVAAGLAPGELRLAFEREAWVRVTDATKAKIASGTSAAGSEKAVRGVLPYELVIGNAAHVTITLDGRAIDLAPFSRDNVARLKIDADGRPR
ncbi:MAG: DUF4115 domain-containing protein [Burkholderiales bacterium]|nr:DUF4115 domain-containing protein [Burkholderiales bacterium]